MGDVYLGSDRQDRANCVVVMLWKLGIKCSKYQIMPEQDIQI